jgi:hypothetical protein
LAKLPKATICFVTCLSIFLPVSPPARPPARWDNSASAGGIFIKLDIDVFIEKYVGKIQF